MSYVKTINEDGSVSDIMAKALEATLDATLLHKSELENDFTQTEAGVNALDAAAGKTLKDEQDSINDVLDTTVKRTHGIKNILPNDDLNTYTEEGEYYITADSVAETISNIPANLAGRLIVEQSMADSGYKRQTYITYFADVFMRTTSNNGTSWTNWKKYLPAHWAGETWSGRALCAGHVTSNGTELHMYIPTRGVAASGFTVSSLVVTARYAAGGYALQNVTITSAVTSCRIYGDGLEIAAKPTWTDAPVNNTPIAIDATFTVTFT